MAQLTPRNSPPETGPAPLLTLKVLLGATRFPVRPVFKDRFTIGSGDHCDLRLGGYLPRLHSVLVMTPSEVLLEQIAATPALVVNGVTQSSAVLRNGDRIRIGGVELEASIPAVSTLSLPSPVTARVDEIVTPTEQAEVDVASLSAEQLLDLLELEQAEIEQDQRGRTQGAQALLEAARGRIQPAQNDTLHGAERRTPGPHWNMARIPLERLMEASARRASGEAALQQKVDTLQLEVARLGHQIHSIVEMQAQSTTRDSAIVADTIAQLRRERTRLVSELNALFENGLASRNSA